MAAKNITVRFRDFELQRIDALAAQMGYSARSDVVRAALELLRSPASRGYREARRTENVAAALIDRLRDRYGRDARVDVEGVGDRRLKVTIAGEVPEGLRAELVELPGHSEAGALVLIADKALVGAEDDLALSAGLGLPWEQWEEGSSSMPLSSFYPRVGPDGARTPLRDPAY